MNQVLRGGLYNNFSSFPKRRKMEAAFWEKLFTSLASLVNIVKIA